MQGCPVYSRICFVVLSPREHGHLELGEDGSGEEALSPLQPHPCRPLPPKPCQLRDAPQGCSRHCPCSWWVTRSEPSWQGTGRFTCELRTWSCMQVGGRPAGCPALVRASGPERGRAQSPALWPRSQASLLCLVNSRNEIRGHQSASTVAGFIRKKAELREGWQQASAARPWQGEGASVDQSSPSSSKCGKPVRSA